VAQLDQALALPGLELAIDALPERTDKTARGVVVKAGTLVDATVIALASIRTDDEARWAGHRRKNPVHGYKAHVATGATPRRTGLLLFARRTDLTGRTVASSASPGAAK
jgi:hypothetical protein